MNLNLSEVCRLIWQSLQYVCFDLSISFVVAMTTQKPLQMQKYMVDQNWADELVPTKWFDEFDSPCMPHLLFWIAWPSLQMVSQLYKFDDEFQQLSHFQHKDNELSSRNADCISKWYLFKNHASYIFAGAIFLYRFKWVIIKLQCAEQLINIHIQIDVSFSTACE